jgi:hypothetical protein
VSLSFDVLAFQWLRSAETQKRQKCMSQVQWTAICHFDARADSGLIGTSGYVSGLQSQASHHPASANGYFNRQTIMVSMSAGSGVGSPYTSHEYPADSL